MRDEIIEVLKKHEGYVDRSRTACCIWSDDYNDIADEIEKLLESHIKTGVVEVLNDSDN
ncbi:MAG: hypothetical protein GY928_23720 [Colwellia sp.]|nr:hypothetical protein [Colwellia sp.]